MKKVFAVLVLGLVVLIGSASRQFAIAQRQRHQAALANRDVDMAQVLEVSQMQDAELAASSTQETS